MSVTPHTDGMIRVQHDSLPYGYADGYLTDDGLFVTRRDGAGWLWDVWASVEAFCTHRNNPAALVAGNMNLAAALAAATEQGESDG
jgi:hypothetical protein